MPSLMEYHRLDPAKVQSFLKFLSRAEKKIREKSVAQAHLEAHLARLRKISTKELRGELALLEKSIANALEKESQIFTRQQNEKSFHKVLKERINELEQKLSRYLTTSEARTGRILQLEEKLRQKSMTQAERKKITKNKVAALERIYAKLKKVKKGKEKVSKTKLAQFKQRIDSLKKKLKGI